MSIRKHIHEELLPASASQLFALLHTPSAIRGWWGANRAIVIPREGGVWAAAWGNEEDDPEYLTTAVLKTFDPPRRLVLADYQYYAKTGALPFQANFTTEFLITPALQGSLLKVTQDGFPCGKEADEFYEACVQGWKDTFRGIREYLKS